jgi:hypothetical protein
VNEKLWVRAVNSNGLCIYFREQQRNMQYKKYRGADKSLARPGRKQATATEDFDFHISYL